MSNDKPRPNFVIGGSPKCGTSSMHSYLGQHPDVYMSEEVKEPGFFCPELVMNVARRRVDEQQYLALFRKANGARRIGESTVWYMLSREAARRLNEWDAASRAILMIRNPVDAAYSLHGHLLWNCTEHLENFEEAIEAQAERREGKKIGPLCTAPAQLQYTEIYTYTPQIKRFFDAMGRDRVKVIVFDDFIRDTPRAYRETLQFLGLDPKFEADFTVKNAVKPVAPRFSAFFAKRPGLRKLYHKVVPGGLRQKLIDLTPYFLKTIPRPSKISLQMRAKLAPAFKDDVEQLSALLGRDLTHWCKV
jgi:hypothetical protein